MRTELISFIKKNSLIELSYRIPLLIRSLTLYAGVICFYVVAVVFKKNIIFDAGGYELSYFPFVMTGIIFSMYIISVLGTFALRMEEEKKIGTLEMLLMSPLDFVAVCFLFYVASFIIIFVLTLPVLLFALFTVKINFTPSIMLAILVIGLISFLVFASFALIIASFIIIFEKGRGISNFINTTFRILGGIYFPVIIMPKGLQLIHKALPISYGLNAFRDILFKGYNLIDVFPSILVLLCYGFVLWPLGIILVRFSIHWAKLKGTLGRY